VALTLFGEETVGLDFSPTQYSALAFVYIEPGIHQNVLGERIALDRSSVTKCVEILEDRVLIRREVDRSDRRARRLFITPEGEKALEIVHAAALRARVRLEDRIGKNEFLELIGGLRAFSLILDETGT
jgi:DNA-binding MarR family transcriptional regulator